MNIKINLDTIKTLLKPLKLYKQTGYASIDRPWDRKKTEIDVPDCNTYDYLLQRSKFNASNNLSRCHEDILTMDRLKEEVSSYAKSFQALGVKKGDIVPLCIQNVNEGLISYFALNSIGAVTTFLNATANKDEIESYIKKFDSKLMLCSSLYLDNVKDLVSEKTLDKVIVFSPSDNYKKGLNLSALTEKFISKTSIPFISNENILDISSFKLLGEDFNIKYPKVGKDDIALISFTSGSTGDPKAIVLTNENIISEMVALKKTTHMNLGTKGNSLQVVPFNYPYGFIISTLLPLYVGKTASLTPYLTLETINDYLKMYKPNYIQAIPSFYSSMMNAGEEYNIDLSYLKYPVSGGDTLDISTKNKINDFLKRNGSSGKIMDGSGNGEGCGCLTTSVVLGSYNPYSVGKPMKGINIKIVDPDTDEELQYGQVGKFCFSGKNVMLEYFGDSSETNLAKKVDENGVSWFYTDTHVHMDPEGWLYIDGRDRRFFITYNSDGSPYKVYCDYVQSVIKQQEEVIDCVVVKKPDEIRSFVPKAYIVTNKDLNQELIDKIIELCNKKLQSCAIPVEFEFVDKISLTKANKIDYSYYEKKADEEFNLTDSLKQKRLELKIK